MTAECSLPLTAIEGKNIQVDTNRSGKTPYGRIVYNDSMLSLDPFSIVTSSLPILYYDLNRGRIDIDLSSDTSSLAKFKMIQDTIISLIHLQQYEWFQTQGLSLESIREKFQPFLQGNVLSIYLSTILRSGKPILVYKSGVWSNSLKANTLIAGKYVRFILRLTGIQSFYSIGSVTYPKNLKCHIVMHPVALIMA